MKQASKRESKRQPANWQALANSVLSSLTAPSSSHYLQHTKKFNTIFHDKVFKCMHNRGHIRRPAFAAILKDENVEGYIEVL